MRKYNQLVQEHLNARKAQYAVKSNVLGVLRGEVETTLKNDPNADIESVVESAAKKMVKSLETVEDYHSEKEIEILTPYLPETLSEDQIKAELDNLDLNSKPNVGAKMGAAMKHLQGRADGNDVKSVVMKYYNEK